MNNFIRHVFGYLIGFSVFIMLIPFGLFQLSSIDPILKTDLTDYLLIRIMISSPFIIVGLIFMIWSNISLFKTGKGGPTDGFNVAISPRTKKLVVTGPYRYSRNPMVFGTFCMYFSIGLFMFSIICLVSLLVFMRLGFYYLKKTEEQRLLKDFGDEYIEYKNKVPMIFPNKLTIK